MAVEGGFGDLRLQPLAQSAPRGVIQAGHVPRPSWPAQDAGRFAEADDARRCFPCQARKPALLVPAVEEGAERRAPLEVKGARALGAVDLVRGHGQQVDPPGPRRSRRAIFPYDWTASVWTRAPFSWAISGDLRDGLDGADLVVGVHDRDQRGLRRHGIAERVKVEEPGLGRPGRK